MELSLRMKQVADMVDPCQVVADIGCDHGYISIYLIEQGIAGHVIAMDVRTGPLSRAREHIAKKGLADRIQCRLSDGMEGLEVGEVDTVIAAGMGGPLIMRILERGMEKGQKIKSFVLQPQSEIPEVRRYLHRIGYEIVQEHMLYEDGKYYTVLKASRQEPVRWKEAHYQYGKQLLEERSPVLYQYLQKEYQQLVNLMNALQRQNTEKTQRRFQELSLCLEWNREAQEYYETANNYELV